MKTSTNLLGWILLCSVFLINLTAKAQDYPYPGDNSPVYSGQTVDCGLLQNPDQKTSPIWFKVTGKIAGTQPHNTMHNLTNPSVTGSYVKAGDYIDVNFNVNKNTANRYSLVSYSIAPDGTRTIFDYQSNIYNASPPSPPVQGNSNQQRVLVPTNCPWEVYWVKGCVVQSFMAGAFVSLAQGPAGNPYASGTSSGAAGSNLILNYTYGNAAPNTVCGTCVSVVNGTNDQVSVQLLEVIDLPATGEKELVFSVINLNGTTAAPLTDFPLIGDVIFSGITPSHHPRNNTPYSFRSDYQLGPVLPGYTVPAGSPNPVFGPKDAFVFDQRNNHNILAYDTYQSEIFRFKVDTTEFNRLSSPNVTPIPQVCIELSPKHPEPHQTLEPIYCFDINFNCGQNCPVVTDTECYKEDCCFGFELINSQVGAGPGEYRPDFFITNLCGETVTSVTFSTPAMATGAAATERVYTISATNSLLTFANPVPPFAAAGDFDEYIYTLPAAAVEAPGGNLATVTVNTTNGSHSFTFNLLNNDPQCGIIPLPVELLNFDGRLSGEDIALSWKTATEENNDRFEIERSLDGRKFTKIGSVKGSGNSSNMLEYGFLDKEPGNGINYYRLNQVDLDGTASHSPIIKVNTNDRGKGPVVQLIPNPCNGESCTVHLKGFTSTNKLTVELRDLTGRMIFSKQVNGDQTSFELPRVTTGNGVYILSARDGNHTTYQKVIIQ